MVEILYVGPNLLKSPNVSAIVTIVFTVVVTIIVTCVVKSCVTGVGSSNLRFLLAWPSQDVFLLPHIP